MADDFVHLHNHSDAGSVLDGFGKLPEYIKRIVELGQRGFGISDHGTVASVYTLINKAREAGITPVPGCEFYVAPQNPLGSKVMKPVFYGPNGQKAAEFDVSSNGAYTHQTMWAVNNEGLTNLFKLSTLSNETERYYSKPRIDFELIADHAEGLVIATGCPSSEISTRLLLNQDKEAYEYANRLKEIFGERMFVEIMEHGMSSNLERRLLPKLLKLSETLKIPLLATNDAHYTYAHESIHHDEMLCSQSGARMSDATWDDGGPRFAFNGNQYYLKSSAEMMKLFPERDFPGAISNTLLVAEMAQDISMNYDPRLKPTSVIPDGHTEVSYFKKLIDEGFEVRYGNSSDDIKREAKKRIDEEFEVIYSSDFIGYFLTVYEYINWTRDLHSVRGDANEILALSVGVGRGSVGGSIISYLLYISELDPIKHDLLFERFLSPGRGDIYEITYEDGTTEKLVVSEKKQMISGEQKYIHQLEVGDEIEIASSNSSAIEETIDSKPMEVSMKTKTYELPANTPLMPLPPESLSDLSKIPF